MTWDAIALGLGVEHVSVGRHHQPEAGVACAEAIVVLLAVPIRKQSLIE